MESTPARDPSPVPAAERIEFVDVLRGLAIFGILLVNVGVFFGPATAQSGPLQIWNSPVDRVVRALVVCFAQGKFIAIFAFLFGVGASIQAQRAHARGAVFWSIFERRMAGLFLIGAIHAFLIWFGDVLLFYAVLGVFLPLAVRGRTVPIALTGLVLFLLPLVPVLLMMPMVALVGPEAMGGADTMEPFLESQRALAERALSTYPTGSFLDITGVRIAEWATIASNLPVLAFWIGSMFLFGVAAGRLSPEDVDRHAPALGRLMLIGLAIALPINIGQAVLHDGLGHGILELLAAGALYHAGGPSLALCYVVGLALLHRSERWQRRLRPLAYAGRMALTHYLTHSVVFTTLAYGYGLGWYGEVSPPAGVAMGIALFGLQIPLSRWWLDRFRFGPVEWAWRSLTYLRLQPFRR